LNADACGRKIAPRNRKALESDAHKQQLILRRMSAGELLVDSETA
jgi:hypothetical protein